MKNTGLLFLAIFIFSFSCTPTVPTLNTSDLPAIGGTAKYLASPYVTAGDRLYMVGHQDGSFPDLGWHVKGEMGGIWAHPRKLMDGFSLGIRHDEQMTCLTQADTFINYPFANRHIYKNAVNDLQIERLQFVPDGKAGILVLFEITNTGAQAQSIELTFNGMVDLRPVWLGERTGLDDAEDELKWDEDLRAFVGMDPANEGKVIFGTQLEISSHSTENLACDFERLGKGKTGTIQIPLSIEPSATQLVPIVIAEDETVYKDLGKNYPTYFQQKKTRYEQIASYSKLTIPDKELEQTFEWLKYNTDWLIRDVPGVGRGLSAGIPDYPWWFGADSEYALQGAIAIGRKDIVEETIDLIHHISDTLNGNGKIIHEVSSNGAVFNPGNINETPQFASLIWDIYQWTGDKAFLQAYFPTIEKGLDWLMTEKDKDGNGFPDGFGMMEIHGLNSEMIDVAAYTSKAFLDAGHIAEALQQDEKTKQLRSKGFQLQQQINKAFWVPEFNSYADFVGTAEQARHLIEDAIVRADTLNKPWAVEELKATLKRIKSLPADQKQGFVLHHNWVVNTPLEVNIAPEAYAVSALETGSQFVNPFGMFVTGIDRDESAGSDDGSFAADKKIFSYTGAVMTLPTGVQAISENNYGRPDQALDYLQRMTRSFSYALPGSMYEVSPDFGMIVQAWNIYSYAVPIVEQFFGIRTHAAEKAIYLRPQMPSSWEEASLENVQIADNTFSMAYEKKDGKMTLRLKQSQEDWKIHLTLPKGQFKTWKVNGEVVDTDINVKLYDGTELTGMEWVIELE